MLGKRGTERGDVLGCDRQTCSGTMAAPAPEQTRARAKRSVQVERRDRTARALPFALGACDQHDGTVEALDETRRDDPDHAFVPVLAGNDVRPPLLLLVRPILDLLHGL